MKDVSINSYICKITFSDGFCDAVTYAALEQHTADKINYAKAKDAIKLMLHHPLLITIDYENKHVAFASFTHSEKISSEIISSFTKEVSTIDIKGDFRIQYLSESCLNMDIKDFCTYLDSGAIRLDNIDPKLKLYEWIDKTGAQSRLEELTKLNAITDKYIKDTYLKDIGCPKLRLVRFNGVTGEYEINKFNKIMLLEGSTKSILKKLSS